MLKQRFNGFSLGFTNPAMPWVLLFGVRYRVYFQFVLVVVTKWAFK
jgi:hypothetical protein